METERADTRTRILDAAQDLVLRHGFAGTSVDAILERVGLTKGAFFHHFPSKNDLAHALIERYAELDRKQLETYLERAERLSRDPVRQASILVGLYEEEMDRLVEPYAGCLFASYCYQEGLFDDRIHAIVRESLLEWRQVLGDKLRAAIERRPPRLPVDADDVADSFLAIAEGAFILSKTLAEPRLAAKQLRQYRNYLELLFDVA